MRVTLVATLVALMPAVVLFFPGGFDSTMAQEPPPDEPRPQLAVADASIQGSGPWTSWFGGRPDRELVLTVVNIGTSPIDDPALILRLGKGADPTEAVVAPALGRLEPGDRITVRVGLELPRFAVGTYVVEGSFPDSPIPVTFRAETSHIPWLVLVLPLLVLIQAGLLRVRNRVRDRIHGPPRTSDPTLPAPEPALARVGPEAEPDLETVVREELERVFDHAARSFDDSLGESEFRDYVLELGATVAERAAARIELTPPQREAFHRAMVESVLEAFDLTPAST